MVHIDDPATQRANLGFIKTAMRTPLLPRAHEFALARRWREAADTAAQHGVLEGVEHAIGIGHLPQHLDQLETLGVGEARIDEPRRAEELGRALRPPLARLLQLIRRRVVEPEMLLQDAPHRCPLRRVEMAIDLRRLHQQRRHPQPHIIRHVRCGPIPLGQPSFEPIHHGPA